MPNQSRARLPPCSAKSAARLGRRLPFTSRQLIQSQVSHGVQADVPAGRQLFSTFTFT